MTHSADSGLASTGHGSCLVTSQEIPDGDGRYARGSCRRLTNATVGRQQQGRGHFTQPLDTSKASAIIRKGMNPEVDSYRRFFRE